MGRHPFREHAGRSCIRALVCLFALAAAACAPADPPVQLARLYQVPEAEADFIFVLDTSRSMLSDYERVRSACIAFLRSLPPSDRVFLVRFARTPQVLTPEGLRSTEQELINRLVPPAPSPSPEGDFTDIGAAFEQVLNILHRRATRSISCVVFLTDGLHNPPPNSAFSRNVSTEPWRALQHRARKIVDGKDFFAAYGVGLGRRTDVQLLSHVFGSKYTAVLPSTPEELAVSLQQLRAKVMNDRLRRAVQLDLSQQSVRWESLSAQPVYRVRAGQTVQLTYRLASEFTVLPVRWRVHEVRALEWVPSAGEVAATQSLAPRLTIQPPEGVLQPQQQTEIRLHLTLPNAETRRLCLPSRKAHQLRFALAYSAHAEPKVEIEQLGLSPAVRVTTPAGSAAFEGSAQVVVEAGEPVLGFVRRTLLVLVPLLAATGAVWYLLPAPYGYLRVQPRRSYPLKGQQKAKGRWLLRFVYICLFLMVLGTAGAIGGFLVGTWTAFYLGTLFAGILGGLVGLWLWGRKEVTIGGLPTCDIYLADAKNTVRFFVQQGGMCYYASNKDKIQQLFDGASVSLEGVNASWHERYH